MAATDQPPKLGKYEILSTLGKGGMGIVYKARDVVIDRTVAIKTIVAGSEGIDENQVARLLMEARSAGRLHHPNIVTVFDYGEKDGVAYIVLEYAEGVDLGQVIASGHSMPLPAKVDILLQVCNGLGFAHDAGVVHRDMKPSNIRLTPQGVAKILDFGLARYDDTHLTKTGFISGTIAYMSPERMNGQTGKSDDIFALGAVAYELLTYTRAFPGASAPEVMFKIMTQTPPAPSTVAEVPSQFDSIILKCLDREAANRFTSAHDFGVALEEAFASSDVQAFLTSSERSATFREGMQSWSTGRRRRGTQATSSTGVRMVDVPTQTAVPSPTQAGAADATQVVASSSAATGEPTVVEAAATSRATAVSAPTTRMPAFGAPGAATTGVAAADATVVDALQPAAPTEIIAAPARKRSPMMIAIAAAAALAIVGGAAVILRRQHSTQTEPVQRQVVTTPSSTSPTAVPSSTAVLATAPAVNSSNVQRAYSELTRISEEVQSKLDAARNSGILVSQSKWDDVMVRIRGLRKAADSGDYETVRTEGEKIVAAAETVIRQHGRPAPLTAREAQQPVRQQTAVAQTSPPSTTATKTETAPPQLQPQPTQPAPRETRPAPSTPAPAGDPRSEISAFLRRVATAYQEHDASFFREHHARYTDAMGNAIKNSPSTRVDLSVESVDLTDADHAKVTVQRMDEFSGGAPAAKQRLAYVLERQGGAWKIVRIERP